MCSLPRRLACMLYDGILLFAVLLLATAPLLLLTGGQAVAHGNPAYDVFLLSISYGYYCWQWVHGGQTLGMKAWRVRLVRGDRAPVSWRNASVRFLHAGLLLLPCGLGIWWALFDRDKLTLYDRSSGTRLIQETD